MSVAVGDFLRLVVGNEGYYCVFGVRSSDSKLVQKFYNSLDTVAVSAANLDSEGYDSYFAMGTFVEGNSRKAANVKQMKSLYLDLDCGEGKPYATQAEAITALRGFCKHYYLPKPTATVNSGRGVHVYWGLTESVPRETWLTAANRLDSACKTFGLEADQVVTIDPARILRVPGTHNYKDFPPKDVYVLGALGSEVTLDSLVKYLPPPTNMRSVVAINGMDIASTLAGNSHYKKNFQDIADRSLRGKGCGHIARAVEKGSELTYAQWTDVLSVAKHCDDADAAIHEVSKHYPDYKPEETNRVAASLQYPHLCVTFDKNCPGICEKCPHNGVIKSPITLGLKVIEATEADNVVKVVNTVEATAVPEEKTITIPKYPRPYFRGANGGVYIRTKDADGEPLEMQVYRDDLYIIKRLYDPSLGPTYVFRLHTPREGVKEFTVPAVKLSSKEEFRKEMGMHDVFLLKADMLMEYVSKWIHELQVNSDQISAKVQFGWTDTATFKSFVLGDKEYFADRTEDNPPSGTTAQHFPAFVPKGTLEGWKETIKFYSRPGFEVHQYMLGTAFGSPLMAFTAIPGAIFHVHSPKSGYGKTTGMFAGASVWGSHQRLVLKAKDTFNSQWLRAEIYKNLPMYIDELTNVEPRELSQFAYNVTDGQQKNRMSNAGANAERIRGEPWNMIVGTTANVSLLERMNLYKHIPHGEAQRVMESRVEKQFFTPEEKLTTDQLSNDLLNNYGHAGPVYIKYVLKNIDGVKNLLKQVQQRLDIAAGLSSENRIWSAQGACVLSGLIIAKKLGLITFDIEALFAWTVSTMQGSKKSAAEMDTGAIDILSQYYAENFQNVLRIKSTDDSRRENDGFNSLIVPDAIPRGQWVMRHEYDVNKLYMMVKPLRAWCTKQQINYAWFIDAAKNSTLKGRKEKMRMGRGTRVNMPPMDVLVVEWDLVKDDIVQSKMDVMEFSGAKAKTD